MAPRAAWIAGPRSSAWALRHHGEMTPLVVQISRWDAMKDAIGVLRWVHSACSTPKLREVRTLVLAGPSGVGSVSDDPESVEGLRVHSTRRGARCPESASGGLSIW